MADTQLVHATMNVFNEQLKNVDDARQKARNESSKLFESVLSISNTQRVYLQRRKQLSDIELEIMQLKTTNKEIKTALMQALVERDELITKMTALKSLNERLCNQNENLNRETKDLLRGDEVKSMCEDFSFNDQFALIREIQDTRYKLIKCGFPLSFFA